MKRWALFSIAYLLSTFLIVPSIAPIWGRECVKESELVEAHSLFYKLANRNYVRPELNRVIQAIASELDKTHPGIRLIYLDANFPFFDKFPLLPHLSHNDGKKIDLSFVYENKAGRVTNEKRSRSGYGAYADPNSQEFDQARACQENGYWQYDITRYLTFGTVNKDIELSTRATGDLVRSIVRQKEVSKLFIEPHLKKRMHLHSDKIRFHGCKAVRHDDHIHIQVN